MKTMRCSGIRVKDRRRCGIRLRSKPNSEGKVWCRYHTDPKLVTSKSATKHQDTSKSDLQSLTCAICLENVPPSADADLVCGHNFHLSCVKQLHNPCCPICRKELKSKKLRQKDISEMNERKDADLVDFDEDQFADFLGGEEGPGTIFNIVMAHAQFTDLVNNIMDAYNTMLQRMRENLPDNPMDLIISLATVVNITESVIGLQMDTSMLHDILLQDIPPLYPQNEISEIHDSIDLILNIS